MSIGPKPKEEKFSLPLSYRANVAFKKVVEAYVKDPIGNLFYFSLGACIVGLLAGRKFPLEFYTILIILGCIEFYKFFDHGK